MAIVLKEAEAARFVAVLKAHDRVLIGLPTLVEFRMVTIGKLGSQLEPRVTALAQEAPFELTPFHLQHLEAATDAFRRFGKGRHPAKLNLGDCMAYAVAAVANCPLLCKGDDFPRTDIAIAA